MKYKPSHKKPHLPAKVAGVRPLTLGLLAAAAVGGVILVSRKASAATVAPGTTPGLAPSPSPTPALPQGPVNPTPAPAGTPNQGLVAGQNATVIAPDGLHLRSGPNVQSAVNGTLPRGTVLLVLDASDPNGWVKVQVPAGVGFVCNTCVEAPGGPWLGLGTVATAGPSGNVPAPSPPLPGDTTPSPPADGTGNGLAQFLSNLVNSATA